MNTHGGSGRITPHGEDLIGPMFRSKSVIGLATLALVSSVGLTSAPAQATAPATSATSASAPDNGLAARAPMGWNSWNKFGCKVTEADVRGAADAIVSSGMRSRGYQYVTVDDCWMATTRDAAGNLTHDPVRFPSGMKSLADYVHARGLKFGLYQSPTEGTCQRRPGSYGHEQQDANSFAAWGVDFLKYDWCQTSKTESPNMWADFPGQSERQVAGVLFPRMADALRKTGRPIVYSLSSCCTMLKFYDWAGSFAHLWRTSTDIYDAWRSVVSNFNTAISEGSKSGPGGWNDPDMLEVGNGGMTDTEYRSHFSMWAMLSAPLIAGNDLSTMTPQTAAILTRKEVIAVDQDRLGVSATRVADQDGTWVLSKPLANGDRAVLLVNTSDQPATVSTTLQQVGVSGRKAQLRDLWTGARRQTTGKISARLEPHASVMLRVTPTRR